MYKIFLAIVWLAFNVGTPQWITPSRAEVRVSGFAADTLDAFITGQMSRHGIRGISIAVTSRTEIVYLKGYGTAGDGRLMTPQTPMYIGSQSKSFTGLAIAQLIEQDRIDPDSPVQTYIPWFFGFSISGLPMAAAPMNALGSAIFGDRMAPIYLMFLPLPTWGLVLSLLFPLTIGFAGLPTYFAYVMPRLEVQLKNGWVAWLIASCSGGF